MRQRRKIEIRGAVQGVGFRPFVYRLADELGLDGWVVNDSRGVTVEAEGDERSLDGFVLRLRAEKPAIAAIESLSCEPLTVDGRPGFEICPSAESGPKTVQVLPDIATCPACLAEVLSDDDRRHGYPFTNCTHCGPRFSIIRSLPYDRSRTTMEGFEMCEPCRSEYGDARDRRFHAQPNACAVCGPSLTLRDAAGVALARNDAAVTGTVEALRSGKIVAVKGLGGFHLMVDAGNATAVDRLRDKKPRREKPFAMMVRDLEQARELCRIDDHDAAALSSPESPILLLRRLPDADVHDGVAPGNPYLGIMLPYTPLHHLLLRTAGFPVIATSGNLSEEPICTSEDEAVRRLAGVAERFLVHDRPIERHVDDSVAWRLDGRTRVLRRARGFAPRPVLVGEDLPVILAVGAHLKNAVALGEGRRVFVSQHIGDMETPEAVAAFERVLSDFLSLYGVKPVAVAHDLHPDYVSTRWARRVVGTDDGGSGSVETLRQARLIAVQHHHAHLASCLADNEVPGPALGVIWDGTGYGEDATVWGGEFLLGDASSFRRVAHLAPFRLPGGEVAVREPRRSAVALLWETLGEATWGRDDLPPVRAVAQDQRGIVAAMLRRGLNSPVTTSAGRLFDGIASLTGLRHTTSFEGQAAMELEFAADPSIADAYPLAVRQDASPGEGEAPRVLDWRPLVEAVVEDLRRSEDVAVMAARFHNALADGIARVAREVDHETVALSGGCFQNRLLTERVLQRLRAGGHRVLLHRRVPPGDGGIALGQVAVAAARLRSDRA